MRVLVPCRGLTIDGVVFVRRVALDRAGGQRIHLNEPAVRWGMRCRQTGICKRQKRGHQEANEQSDQA